jgi:hypothetical protein
MMQMFEFFSTYGHLFDVWESFRRMGIVRLGVLLQGSDLEAQRCSVNARFRVARVLSGTLQTPPTRGIFNFDWRGRKSVL